MYDKGPALERAINKVTREAYRRVPLLRMIQGYSYHEALEAHAPRLPSLDPRDLPLLEGLRRDGAMVLNVDDLGFGEANPMFAALDKLVPELASRTANGDNQPRLAPKRMMEFPEVYALGLNERLLRLVENYIGLPIKYHGVDVRREVADGKPNDVRQWHLDNEDWRMCRMIVYLNDVDASGGPFEYVQRSDTIAAAASLGYVSGFVTDARMERVVPRARWHKAIGKAHTVAFADTARVFHRASPPVARDRYSITLTWTSRQPLKDYPAYRYTPQAWDYFVRTTSPAAMAALPDQLTARPV